ncbi:hypothetical protein N9X46_06420 [Paracoccaceae bacterium]|nr:hypothetical protein [Paracoccaceae bacterium]MDB3948720.1 hypothetical protein [Paracoccaceae bacterium]MDC3290745.1 hypothetical protein [bacterium]
MAGTRSANTADVEKSIQIALDAADAAMDVTSEYAKVAQQIKRSTAKLANIEKLGRIAVILGFVSGIGAAALCIVIFLQSSSQLKLLSQTNTELLTVFIENVDSLNEDVAKLTPALDEINNLTNVVETASAGLAKIGEKSDMLSEKSDMTSEEVRNAIEQMNMIEPMVKAQLAEQQEKSAILNSELTLSFAEMTNEEFKAQNMIMGNFTRSVIEALQTISDASAGIKEQRDALQALQEVNTELSARVATLDQKLSSAKKEAAQARKARAQAVAAPKPEGDIIKFP